MENIILIVHLLIAIALIGVILLQRSEGGALGMGGGSGGGGGGMFSARGAANALTRTTAILAACFIATSLTLAILAGGHKNTESEGGAIAAFFFGSDFASVRIRLVRRKPKDTVISHVGTIHLHNRRRGLLTG